ncbi:hypothetical protein [Streptomyces albogriseolus]|uniref:hypothetical protein n=1 Tax=Streptomyces albogriseolus TaxID=1887 RepID=UPI0034602F00
MNDDAISAAVAAEMFPPPPGGRTAHTIRAAALLLLPDRENKLAELYESNGVRVLEGPWTRGLAAAIVARGLSRGSAVSIEYGELVVRHADGSSSTLTPAHMPFVRPYAEPGGCRWCGLPRPHGRQYVTGIGSHNFVEPSDVQRLARMKDRRKRRKGQ